MTSELQLFQSMLEILKEQRKDIAKLQVSCVALRNALTAIDPNLDAVYQEWFAQTSAVPKPLAQEQIDGLIEQVIQLMKTGHDPVH
jgi:hypothetical protein